MLPEIFGYADQCKFLNLVKLSSKIERSPNEIARRSSRVGVNNRVRSPVINTKAHQIGVAMPKFNQSVVVTAFVLGLILLLQFNQDLALPRWLAPFSLGRLLSIMQGIFPQIQRGSLPAFVIGYLLMGVLVFNMAVLFTVAHLPGKMVALSSPISAKAGLVVLGLLGTGLWLLLKGLVNLLVGLVKAIRLAWTNYQSDRRRVSCYLNGSVMIGG
jgi:hypothetical protein